MKAIYAVIDGHLEYLRLRTGNNFEQYNYSQKLLLLLANEESLNEAI